LLSAGGAVGTLLGAPLALLLWAAAWFSGARTSLILVAAGAVALAMATGARGRSRRLVIGGLVLAAGALAGVLVAGSPRLLAGTPVDRFLSALPQSSPQAALYEVLWRRDGYGLAAVEAIREHPLTGVGVGRFAAVSSGYHQRLTGRAIPPDNAQNFWRHTLAEQGILGLLPVLWLTLLSLRSLISAPAVGEDLVMKVMLAGLGVALLFGYPVQDPAIAVTVGTLVAAVGRARADAF
jgi:O-antigen ligase